MKKYQIFPIILFGMIFFLVYKFRIGFYDMTIIITMIAAYFVFIDRSVTIDKRVIYIFFSVGVLYLYIIISTAIQNPEDPFYILKYSRVLLSLTSTYIILTKIVNKYRLSTVEYCLAFVLLVHPAFMILQIIVPDVKYFWMEIYGFTGHYHEHRVVGLQNGHSSAGNFLGITSVYFAYISKKYKSILFLFVFIAIAPLFLLSSLTGGIVYGIAFLYLIYSLVVDNNYIFIKYMLSVGLAALGILVSLLLFFPSISQSLGLYSGVQRITVLFINDQTTRDDPRGSVNSLIDSFFVPSELSNFIFGNLEPSKTEAATTNTDSGFFASWHTLGLVGLSILLLTKALFAYLSKSLFIYVLTLMFLVVFIKNDISYSRIFFDYYFVVFLLVLFEQKGLIKNED